MTKTIDTDVLGRVKTVLASVYRTDYDQRRQHVSVERLEAMDNNGEHERADVFFDPNRGAYDIYVMGHHHVYSNWTANVLLDSAYIMSIVSAYL